MGVFENLLKRNKKNQLQDSVPEGYCPNCWGRQEYGGEFFEAVYKEKIDSNSQGNKKSWLRKYASEKLEGIKLEEKDGVLVCKGCNLTYRRT